MGKQVRSVDVFLLLPSKKRHAKADALFQVRASLEWAVRNDSAFGVAVSKCFNREFNEERRRLLRIALAALPKKASRR